MRNSSQFSASAPLHSHWQRGRCKDADCPRYLMGFRITLDLTVPKMAEAAEWLRSGASGRQFVERQDVENLLEFTFPPGQACFRQHYEPIGRPPILSVRTEMGSRRFAQGRDWNEAYNEEAYALRRVREGG